MKQLTNNFSLQEFILSQTASRRGIDNYPPVHAQHNLRALCEEVLQPLRDSLGVPIRITSGFRCKELNEAIGGSKSSQHMAGHAADIQVPGLEPVDVCQRIIDLDLPFDQLIHEFGSWVHVSFVDDFARNEVLTAELKSGKTVYSAGLS